MTKTMRLPLSTATMLGVVAAWATLAGAVGPYDGYRSDVYGNTANWVCHPDSADACDEALDTTHISAAGAVTIEPWTPAARPAFDCFYVYPTISTDMSGNSDRIPGEDQEIFVARQQAARLGSVCRVFAPVYRQVTLTALLGRLSGMPVESDSALADADLLDAWKHYIANDNGGRGVLLIGHSQGASRLTTLLRNEIDPNPVLRRRLVSAMLLGANFQVPVGGEVGGQLDNIPLCASGDERGCVIAYASFRATAPPPANTLFGRSLRAGWQAACTNPAQLATGTTVLHAYLPTDGRALPLGMPRAPEWIDPELGVSITTPFVSVPNLLEAECREDNGFVYLAITVNGDPDDPRVDDIGGDITPDWGLHLVDVNVAMGDLVTIAARQGEAHVAGQCPGDCDTDGVVLVDELLYGVSVLLGRAPLGRCAVLDRDQDADIAVDEIVAAVDSALSGCAPSSP